MEDTQILRIVAYLIQKGVTFTVHPETSEYSASVELSDKELIDFKSIQCSVLFPYMSHECDPRWTKKNTMILYY